MLMEAPSLQKNIYNRGNIWFRLLDHDLVLANDLVFAFGFPEAC